MENLESYLFLLKKFLGGLLMPLPMTFLLLFWALLLLLRNRTRWFGVLFVLLATTLLFVASYAPLSSRLTGPLERQFASYQPGELPVAYVAVLGSGHVSGGGLPLTSEIKPEGVIRLVEGIRIYRLNPGSKLIFTGYHGGEQESYTDKIVELAIALGVPQEDILPFTGPKDTADEAQLIAANFSGAELVLVTSASHMPRAMGLFRTAGLDPIPAPTNHMTRAVRSYWLFPSAHTLSRSQSWLYEKLGLAWSQLTGQIKTTDQ
ncbi:MAG TPA: ElyC/SanA/YdcF family protein [Malonomonas sp.]